MSDTQLSCLTLAFGALIAAAIMGRFSDFTTGWVCCALAGALMDSWRQKR